jgi:magnesium transporter
MEEKIFEVNKEGIEKISLNELPKKDDPSSSIYLIDIKTKERLDASKELQKYGLQNELCNYILEPSENLRFEYLGDTLYGEIAYFSSKTKKPDYAGIVIRNNLLFLIHATDEGMLIRLIRSFTSFTEKQKNKITDIKSLLYLIIHEILSYHGKLILSYREEVELLADKFENKKIPLEPEDILESKSQLSNLSRVIEKLIYTLSIPPAENVLDLDNPYRIYFEDLLKGINLFKMSMERTKEQLDSINDHFQLLMQEKMNKRLNFLTIIQSIFVPLTLIAGIYGMNFKFMPELELKYGYFFILGLMVVTSVFFIRYFYKNGWFD